MVFGGSPAYQTSFAKYKVVLMILSRQQINSIQLESRIRRQSDKLWMWENVCWTHKSSPSKSIHRSLDQCIRYEEVIYEHIWDHVRGGQRMDDTEIPDDGRRLMAVCREPSGDQQTPRSGSQSQLSFEPAPGHTRAGAWHLMMGRAQWLCPVSREDARWGG